MIYAPVVKVVTRKVYADPGQEEALLDCYVHGEPKPTVRSHDSKLKLKKLVRFLLKHTASPLSNILLNGFFW